MKVFYLCILSALLGIFTSGIDSATLRHPVCNLLKYKEKRFLTSLETVMRQTAQQVSNYIERYKIATKEGLLYPITDEQKNSLFALDCQFDAFYKAIDNDDECCDRLLLAFFDTFATGKPHSATLSLAYLSTLFMHRNDLSRQLCRLLKVDDIKRLQHDFDILKCLFSTNRYQQRRKLSDHMIMQT